MPVYEYMTVGGIDVQAFNKSMHISIQLMENAHYLHICYVLF